MTNNKQLRELAEAAKSGAWYESGDLRYHNERSGETHGLHHDEDGFIAAASPETIMALLDENEALQAENERLLKEVMRLRVAMAKAAQRADDWPDSNDDPADVLSDCASILFDALDYRQGGEE